MTACRVCGNQDGNRAFVAREAMFASGEAFDYLECGGCGCLQIAEIPDDLGRHYPDRYYSFDRSAAAGSRRLLRVARRFRLLDATGSRGVGAAIGRAIAGRVAAPHYASWLRTAGAGTRSRILDLGCGGGTLIAQMHADGCRHVSGADPFIESDLDVAPGVTVRKADAHDLTGTYDVVMAHHSFEHVVDPGATLTAMAALLAPGGTMLIRIPVVGWAWREYGTDWVGLDAPRHLHVHTERSMEVLAAAAGLVVTAVEYDSTDLQFRGSELYRRGLPLDAPAPFTAEQIAAWRAQADALNATGDGDAAAFWLTSATLQP